MQGPLIFVILDGMTEGGETPDAPFLPQGCGTLTRLAREGGFGALDNTPPGLPVDSLTCITTLLGVPPQSIPVGRAYLEALAAGVAVTREDAVCRLNLTALSENGTIQGARAVLPAEEARALCEKVSEKGCKAYHLGGYKNLLLMRGAGCAGENILTYPPHQHAGQPVAELLPQGGQWARCLAALAQKSRFALEGTEYILFPWDVSTRPSLPQFHALHGGSAACVCKTEVVRGLCAAMGIAVVVPPGATAEEDTGLHEKANAALALASTHDVVFVHVNGADELAHRRDASGKARFLRRADAELLATLAHGLPPGARLLVCSDHATSAKTGCHVGGAQPFLLWEKGGAPRGPLGTHPGTRAVELLKKGGK